MSTNEFTRTVTEAVSVDEIAELIWRHGIRRAPFNQSLKEVKFQIEMGEEGRQVLRGAEVTYEVR